MRMGPGVWMKWNGAMFYGIYNECMYDETPAAMSGYFQYYFLFYEYYGLRPGF